MLNKEDNRMWRSRGAVNDWRNHFLWVPQNELQLQEMRNTRVQGRNIQMQEAAILRSVHPWKKKLSHKVRGHLGMVSASMQMRVRLIQVFLSFFQIELQAFFFICLYSSSCRVSVLILSLLLSPWICYSSALRKCICPYPSEMAATHSEELVEGTVSNGAVSTQVSDMGDGADGADGDEGTSLAVVDPLHFIHGQLVWAKFARFPWWPAQVSNFLLFLTGTVVGLGQVLHLPPKGKCVFLFWLVKEGSDGKLYWKLLWFIRYIWEWFECLSGSFGINVCSYDLRWAR